MSLQMILPTAVNAVLPTEAVVPALWQMLPTVFTQSPKFEMNDTIVVAFSNQKGGVGKSTFTVLLASYLYYVKGVNVAILDCDSPQHSLDTERKRELSDVEHSPHLSEMAGELTAKCGKQPYAIVPVKLEEAVDYMRLYLESEDRPRILFLDLPGTMNNIHVVRVISNCDYVFCPMAADKYEIESTIGYCNYIREQIITGGQNNLKEVYILWNKIDARERTELYHEYDDFLELLNIEPLKTSIPSSVRFKKSLSVNPQKLVFRSTLFPPDKSLLRGSNVEQLADEITSIIGVKYGEED